MALLCGSANVTINYPYITVSQHNTLEKFSFICRKITEFRHTEPRPESLVEVVPAQPAPGFRWVKRHYRWEANQWGRMRAHWAAY
jgi:hypothetical protein